MIKKLLATAAILSLAFVGVMGFAHTRPGRPLLAVIGPIFGMGPRAHGGSGRCPFGFDIAASAEEKEAARARFAAQHRGSGRAGARLALGFALDETRRGDVLAWAATHGVSCKAPRVGADLTCASVPARALPAGESGPALEELWFTFGASDQLTGLVALRKEPTAPPIAAAFRAAAGALTSRAGPPSASSGAPDSAALEGGLLRQASVEYRFRDYYALARATNMGDGYLLTEEYRSLD